MMFYYNTLKNLTLYENDEIDYSITRHKWWFYRSPQIDITSPYVCCIGDSFTFGRNVNFPYPLLLKNYLKIPALNLSCGHMHPNLISEKNILMELVQKSKLTIIQFRPYHNYDKLLDKLKTPVIWLNLSEIERNQMINVRICKGYPNQDDHLKIAKEIFSFILKHPNIFSYFQD